LAATVIFEKQAIRFALVVHGDPTANDFAPERRIDNLTLGHTKIGHQVQERPVTLVVSIMFVTEMIFQSQSFFPALP
jgi:hypothetical protein